MTVSLSVLPELNFDIPYLVNTELFRGMLEVRQPVESSGSAIQSRERLTNDAIDLLKDIVRAPTLDREEALFRKVQRYLGADMDLLGAIALDRSQLINVRAFAARLLVSFSGDDQIMTHERVQTISYQIQQLSTHVSPLIRLGCVHGFADSGDYEKVRAFTLDSHQVVAEEADDLLEEYFESQE